MERPKCLPLPPNAAVVLDVAEATELRDYALALDVERDQAITQAEELANGLAGLLRGGPVSVYTRAQDALAVYREQQGEQE